MPKSIRLTEMISRTGDIVYRFQGLQFTGYHPARGANWEPPVNVYRCDGKFEICIELAGIAKENIQVSVFSDRLEVKGRREQPMPAEGNCCRRILAMEIETGEFFRRVPLPEKITRKEVAARQENGLLWITLPIAEKPKSNRGEHPESKE